MSDVNGIKVSGTRSGIGARVERSSTGLLALVAVVLGVMAVSVAFDGDAPNRDGTPDREVWYGNSAHLPELFPGRQAH
ncbi:hypothetical protein [Acuticoccus sediminis]|uniref:hypothetical protein n=1 Tax=Acuticoccus sediminis TaxID=2184697 RepID=UPI001CFEACC1|nr:hypothetical protein [Acuticoccus sediminis]